MVIRHAVRLLFQWSMEELVNGIVLKIKSLSSALQQLHETFPRDEIICAGSCHQSESAQLILKN